MLRLVSRRVNLLGQGREDAVDGVNCETGDRVRGLTGYIYKFSRGIEDSGEGRWTVEESINLSVPAPVIALSLQMRFRSRQDNSFSSRMLAAMRQQFGGHAVKKAAEK